MPSPICSQSADRPLHMLPMGTGAEAWHTSLQAHVCVRAELLSRVRLFASLWTVGHRLLCPWDSPGKNTGVACHALLQGNLPNPWMEPTSHNDVSYTGRWVLYHCAPGKPISPTCDSILRNLLPTCCLALLLQGSPGSLPTLNNWFPWFTRLSPGQTSTHHIHAIPAVTARSQTSQPGSFLGLSALHP